MDFASWVDRASFAGPHESAWWPWVTVLLSSAILAGYGIIAFNWYFQAKLARHADAEAALRRLRNICLTCVICGCAFFLGDIPWIIWRLYDVILAAVLIYTWLAVLRMRGMSLVVERLAQLDELERAVERYREIAELLPHMVWTAGADGRVDSSNQRWRQFAGDNRTWLEAIHPDEQLAAAAKWNAATAARVPVNLEVKLGGTSGYRTFLVTATPIVRGEALKWLGACADIEAQKQLVIEKELQAKQKTFFLNALSHDLRAPLHNVVLNAHLLKLSVRDPADVQSVGMILENAVAAAELVTRLLDFARVEAQDKNVVEAVSLAATVRQVVRRFQPISEQKGLYLKVTGDGDVKVLTDRQKLERIISNLVDNAIKYTNRGGVSVGLAAGEDEVAVRVSDTGIGIPQDNVPHLFGEFYQVNNYDRDRSKGFGMGLAICKSLAHHIGGDVRLAETGPQGSCFEVVVKAARTDAEKRPGDAPAAAGVRWAATDSH